MAGRGGRNSFFDPFAGFSGFGGMGGHQNLFSSVFGGRDPFDDPFFTRPFGSPFGSMFESGLFGGNCQPFIGPPSDQFFQQQEQPFIGASPDQFLQQQEPQPNKRRGPVIEELNSDDDDEEDGAAKGTNDNHPRKHSRLAREPYIEIPEDESDDRKNKHVQYRNEFNRMNNVQPRSQPQCYTFQSSTVSYGGTNGAYFTKSSTKRAGSDGVVFEEFKEADSTTGQANHRISRGLQNKGHTLARKLNPDGRVDTRQTLHNLNEDELSSFENAWEGSAGRHLTGGRLRLDGGNSEPGSTGEASRSGWALPSTQRQDNNSSVASGNHAAAHVQQSGKRVADHGLHGKRRI